MRLWQMRALALMLCATRLLLSELLQRLLSAASLRLLLLIQSP
jgi:hypothetical protein